MDIEKMLKNYNKSLQPSKDQQDRVFLRVFGELPEPEPRNKIFIIFDSMFKNKFVFAGLAMLIVLGFFGIPLGIVSLNQVLTPAMEKASVDLAPTPQTTSSTSNAAGTTGEQYLATPKSLSILPDVVQPTTLDRAATPEDTTTPDNSRAKEQTGSFTLECSDVQSNYQSIKNMATDFGGYVVSASFNSGTNTSAQISIRVPADKFDNLVGKIRELDAKIVLENINTIDQQNQLTELNKTSDDLKKQISDLQTKISQETDAGKKADLQDQHMQLQDEQNQNDAWIKQIKTDTSFSTVDVELTQSKNLSFGDWKSLGSTLQMAVNFWGQVLIWLFVPVILIYLVYRLIRRKRK